MWDHLRVSQLLSDILSRGTASLLGAFLVAATTLSLMRTVVIPRALPSIISDTVSKAVIWFTVLFARLRRSYSARDSALAWIGPSIILLQLITWLILYLIAYGLLIYGVSGQDLGNSMRESGSSLLTLGFASVNTESQTLIDFMAAATGPIVIAMLIGFLPTIYAAYLDREVDVTMLSAIGGEPAWGPELLARAAIGGTLDSLPLVMLDWARWATRLRMTHVIYPVLIWVRGTRSTRHFVVSLLAVLDAAALDMSLTRKQPRDESLALILEGGQAIEVIYTSLFAKRGWSSRRPFTGTFTGESTHVAHASRFLPTWNKRALAIQIAADMDAIRGLNRQAVDALQVGEQHPLTITRADFDAAVAMLQRSGYPIDRDLDDAWEQFHIARSRYEFAALQICTRLDATPAPWSGPRRIPTPTIWPTLAVDILPAIEAGQPVDPDPATDSDGSA
jgi:hypothetical protein